MSTDEPGKHARPDDDDEGTPRATEGATATAVDEAPATSKRPRFALTAGHPLGRHPAGGPLLLASGLLLGLFLAPALLDRLDYDIPRRAARAARSAATTWPGGGEPWFWPSWVALLAGVVAVVVLVVLAVVGVRAARPRRRRPGSGPGRHHRPARRGPPSTSSTPGSGTCCRLSRLPARVRSRGGRRRALAPPSVTTTRAPVPAVRPAPRSAGAVLALLLLVGGATVAHVQAEGTRSGAVRRRTSPGLLSIRAADAAAADDLAGPWVPSSTPHRSPTTRRRPAYSARHRDRAALPAGAAPPRRRRDRGRPGRQLVAHRAPRRGSPTRPRSSSGAPAPASPARRASPGSSPTEQPPGRSHHPGERRPEPVGPPSASRPAPSTRDQASSLPASSRHDHSRRVRWCSLCSWVNPIAPCTWCASRATTSTAAPARTFAAAAASTKSVVAVVQRLHRGVGQRRHRGHLAGHLGELHLDGLELAPAAGRTAAAPPRTAPSRPAPAPAPRPAAPPAPARSAARSSRACAGGQQRARRRRRRRAPASRAAPRPGSTAPVAGRPARRPAPAPRPRSRPVPAPARRRAAPTPAQATSGTVPVEREPPGTVAVVDRVHASPRRRSRR